MVNIQLSGYKLSHDEQALEEERLPGYVLTLLCFAELTANKK